MDVAYDHIAEENFPDDEDPKRRQGGGGGNEGKDEGPAQEQSINQEFQDAYKAFSASPWGVKLGGFWATAKKQVRLCSASVGEESG